MIENEENVGLSFEDSQRLATALEIPTDLDFYERTAFDSWDLIQGLQTIICGDYLPNEGQELIRALRLAILGMHPKFRLHFERPEGDKTFAQVARLQRHLLGRNIAQKIDVAVARGSKLEAEVQEACDSFGLSRREIFRMLKETRESRKQWEEMDRMNGQPTRSWPVPEGLTIDPSGKLVPKIG